jgi:hypothetical protein
MTKISHLKIPFEEKLKSNKTIQLLAVLRHKIFFTWGGNVVVNWMGVYFSPTVSRAWAPATFFTGREGKT